MQVMQILMVNQGMIKCRLRILYTITTIAAMAAAASTVIHATTSSSILLLE